MATQVDPLRSTLDHLVVDPAAKADRPYLESMLRRLGYSEVEIQAYLGAAPAAPASATAPDAGGARDIEIEYTGPGLREYAIVVPPDTTSFGVDAEGNPLDLGQGLTAGEEVLEGGPSMAEVDAMMEKQDLSDFGEFAGMESEVGKMNVVEGEEGLTDFGDQPAEGAEGEAAAPAEGDLVEFGEKPPEDLVEFGEAAPKEETPQVGEELVIFQSNPVNFGYATLTPPGPAAPAEGDEGEAAAGDEAGEEAWPTADEGGSEEPFTYRDWTLYSRAIESSEGRPQRVYFFAKGEPSDGEPAAMPPGYEVGENDRTGLPYLRRSAEELHPEDLPQAYRSDATPTAGKAKKRVRMKKVRAASREEAEASVRREGGDVLTSVPVDIKERWEE